MVIETDCKSVSQCYSVVAKGKTDSELLVGCDTPMELGVLRNLKGFEKEKETLSFAAVDNISGSGLLVPCH